MQEPHTVSILHKVTMGGTGDGPESIMPWCTTLPSAGCHTLGPGGAESTALPSGHIATLMPESLGSPEGEGGWYVFSKEAASVWLTGC